MKVLSIFLLLLIASQGVGQVKSVVVDSESKETIPFVNIWVENEGKGTTSDLKGVFEIAVASGKTLVFSAIGYQTTKLRAKAIGDTVCLKPSTIVLSQVTIIPSDQPQTHTIGKIRKPKINSYFFCGNNPWMVARQFKYKPQYDSTPFLEKINILTKSEVKDARFNVRLYQLNEQGEPAEFLYD